MFCPTCGSGNVTDIKFCTRCGTNRSLVSDAVAGKPPGNVQIDERMVKGRMDSGREMKALGYQMIENRLPQFPVTATNVPDTEPSTAPVGVPPAAALPAGSITEHTARQLEENAYNPQQPEQIQ